MSKDKRYSTVKFLIESGHIKTFVEIFDTIPKTVVAKDFGTNYQRFTRLLRNPERLRLSEVYTLAGLFGVDEAKMFQLVHAQYLAKKRKR